MRTLLGRLPVILIASAVATTALGQNAAPERLTNADVIKMGQADLAPSIILTTVASTDPDFDVSPDGLINLKTAGVTDEIIEAMLARARASEPSNEPAANVPSGLERSARVAASTDPDFILRNFRTMILDTRRATFFGDEQLAAALGQQEDFAALGISLVDDPAVADVVLEVAYTFAWDYPFTLRHQNSSIVLLTGKGSGPFSGPRGATSVADELVKALKPFRQAPAAPSTTSP